MMTSHHVEYYQKLSLPPVPPVPAAASTSPLPSIPSSATNKTSRKYQKYQEQELEQNLRDIINEIDSQEIQERLKQAMDKIVLSWTERHDAMVDALEYLECAKRRVEHRLNLQQQQPLREAQLYKTRYEALLIKQQQVCRRTSIPSSSNASCLSGKSYATSRYSTSSSSMRTSFSLVDELIDPIAYFDQHNLLMDSEDDEDNNNQLAAAAEDEFDLYSVLSDPDYCTLPANISPYMTPVVSPLSLKSPSSAAGSGSDNYNNNESSNSTAESSTSKSTLTSIPAQLQHQNTALAVVVEEEAFTFACGDGFWNTIARGKSNKVEVDTLISNYIRRGGNPNVAKNSDNVKNVKEGYGLIHALIAVKNTSALLRILDAGAKINVYPLTSKREDKLTPLMLAAKSGYMNGVRLIIEKTSMALLNESRGPYGENALHAAVQGGSDEMAGYLLRLSQNSLLEKADNNGATPLHYACITGKTRLVTLFIRDCHSRSDPRDNKGETPLHYAVRNRKLKVIAKLIELGCYPNPYILKQVPTPLDLAKAGGLKTIAEYLKRVGAKTTKEMEKQKNNASNISMIHSSNSSILSGESSTSSGNDSQGNAPSVAVTGVRQYLHSKTSQILRGTFDL